MPRRRPGIKGRLDQVQGKANQTMDVAQGVMLRLEAKLDGAVDEVLDGIDFELVRKGDASMMDFFTGKVSTLPFSLRIVPRE